MNIKLVTLASAFAFASAMAQDATAPAAETSAEEATVAEAPAEEAQPAQEVAQPAPAPAPAPVAEPAPAPVEEAKIEQPVDTNAANFDVVRGRAYNNVGNQAAASTIADNIASPYNMAGSKLVYLEPTNSYAAVSFGEGLTKFIVFDNQANLGHATFGIATKGFGVSVGYAFNKRWDFVEDVTADQKDEASVRTVTAGDLFDATFAAPLGGLDITVNALWRTYQTEINATEEVTTEDDKMKGEIDQDFWDYGGVVTLSNSPSAKTVFWAAGVAAIRHSNYTEVKVNGTKTKVTGNTANISITPMFNIGLPILSTTNARVLLGANTEIPLVFYDEIKDENRKNKDNYHIIGVETTPNILAELALGKCWMVFGGAAYTWDVFDMEQDEYVANYDDADTKHKQSFTKIESVTGMTTVNAGARFQYSNFALEASIQNSFYNNPLEGFNGTNFLAQVGGFIYF